MHDAYIRPNDKN